MLMSDKPLHVRVAEALGCHATLSFTDHGWHCECHERTHAEKGPLFGGLVFRYDTDWSATGPLIEQFGLRLFVLAGTQGWASSCAVRRDGSVSLPGEFAYDVSAEFITGTTPLIAVCNLILALHEAGKLKVA